MAIEEGTRLGGRGCPRCGRHDTEGVPKHGVQWCLACTWRWTPCSTYCRGYRVEVGKWPEEPKIMGCVECGVPNRIARWWPEAWRAMAVSLAKFKMDPLTDVG